MKKRAFMLASLCLTASLTVSGPMSIIAGAAEAAESDLTGQLAFAQCEEYINIRDTASTDGEVTAKIYNNGAVTILGQEGDWYEVKSGNAVGYVKAEYFATGEEAQQIAGEIAYNVAKVHPEYLNIRSGPSEDYSLVTVAEQSDELEVVAYDGDWMKVALGNDVYGYVNAYYVAYKTYYPVAETVEEEQARLQAEQEAAEAAWADAQAEEVWTEENWEDTSSEDSWSDSSAEDSWTDTSADDAWSDNSAEDSWTDTSADDTWSDNSAEDSWTDTSTDDTWSDTSAEDSWTDTSTEDTWTDDTSTEDSWTDTSTDDTWSDTSAEDSWTDTSTDDTWSDTSAEDSWTDTSTEDTWSDTSAEDSWTDTSTDDTWSDTSTEDSWTDTSTEDSWTEETEAPSTSSLGTDIANYAVQFVGNPYVWGGTSLTNGADCSGFVQSVFANFGIGLSRTAASQACGGVSVSLDNLQAGDLVFYSHGSGIDHVALYIGGGQVVHAANSNSGIIISNCYYNTPVSASRYW